MPAIPHIKLINSLLWDEVRTFEKETLYVHYIDHILTLYSNRSSPHASGGNNDHCLLIEKKSSHAESIQLLPWCSTCLMFPLKALYTNDENALQLASVCLCTSKRTGNKIIVLLPGNK